MMKHDFYKLYQGKIMKYLFYFFILFITPHSIAYEYELALCAMFQNEGRFMKEWLEFYKLLGVEHFYLYDNSSTDNYTEILEPYIQAGIVELTLRPGTHEQYRENQKNIYNHCLNKVRGKVKWLAIVDLDEFLFPVQQDNLRDFLKNYEQYAAVAANWVMFGTSDIDIVPENKLMIETLTKREFINVKSKKLVKSIVRPDRVDEVDTHGPTKITSGYLQVTADAIPCHEPACYPITTNALRVNHYWTRDKKWLYDVKIPRAENIKLNLLLWDDEIWYISWKKAHAMTATEFVLTVADFMNKKQDLTIQRFVEPLRKILQKVE